MEGSGVASAALDLVPIYGTATALAIVVTCGVEVLKAAFNIPLRFVPLLALVLGILGGALAAPLVELPMAYLLWSGGISGFMASGIFSTVKQAIAPQRPEKEKEEDV